jgi:tetratricopeptide (TPR) repeat protein
VLVKEMAAALPAILVLAALAAAQGPGLGQGPCGLRRGLPHAIVLLGYGLARLYVGLPQLLTGKESGAADPVARALTAVATVGRYLQLDLVLFEPTPFYEGRLTAHPLDPWFLLGLVALAGGAWLAAWAWRRDPLLFFGVAWFFVTLIPVANLVPIPGVRDAAIAERYLYIPSIGVCLALGAAGARLAAWAEQKAGLPRRGVTAGLLLLAVGLYAPVTLRWTPIWRSNETLYRQMIRRSPEAAFPHISLAATLMARGQAAEAQALVARALALGPTRPEVHRVDGAMRLARGDLDGALTAMRRAHSLMPESVPTLIELGTTLAERGELREALDTFRRALAIDPQAVEAENRMGVAYFRARRLPEAAQAFRRATERSPDFVFAHSNLAATLDRMNRTAEALASIQTALRLAPGDPRLTALYSDIQARMPGAPPRTREAPRP